MKMKKYFSLVLVIFLQAGFVFAQETLDATLKHASGNLSNRIPLKSKVLVLHFKASTSDMQDYIIDGLIAGLKKNPALTVLEKRNTLSIIENNNLPLSEELNDEKAIAIAKDLGVGAVVFGAIVPTVTDNASYRFNVQAISVQTAKIYWSNTYAIAEDDALVTLSRK
jgi:TolB-like protein